MSRGYVLALLLIPLSVLLTPSQVVATDYQKCTTSSTCIIGEFLYNDDYTILPGQSCTLTAKNPDGTAFVTAAAMTSRADGWYSYDATIGTTTGLYTATICCTPTSGNMCLDKSFEVSAPAATAPSAADIWSYSNRTMTSYGTLVNDIWGYSSRSLTSFGNLVTDIWGYSSRTMTSFGSLVTDIWGVDNRSLTGASTPAPSTLQNIITEQTKQRELLEKLVNAPIVTLSLEDNNAPDLSVKLDESKKQASILYDAVQSSKSRLMTLDGKWSRLSADALSAELTSISSVWTEPVSLVALSKAWNNPIVESLNNQSGEIKSSLTALLASATVSKSNMPPSTLFATVESLSALEEKLGDVTSSSGDTTLFGYLASVSERDSLLENESQKLALVLEDWDSQGESILNKRVRDSQARLLTINEFPGEEDIITPSNPSATGKTALKNLVFSLQGLIGLNRVALASNVNAPVRGLWLEEGSIIFRAAITNPSTLVAQSAPLKFFLPRELHNENIMTIDPSLTANYDTIQESLAVTGTYDLKPGATKIVAVEVEDVWQLSDTELTTLRTKAGDLLKPLEKSPLLSQGVVLKSSIESDIDKLLHAQNKNVKPENRIRNYREAQLALASTKANMTQLETLVAQATSNSSLMGFVGGVSTTAVFGIILVVVAGFIFMSVYFKKLGLSPVALSSDLSAVESVTKDRSELLQLEVTPKLSRLDIPAPSGASGGVGWQMPAIIAAVVVVTAGSTIVLTRMAQPKTPSTINEVSRNEVISPAPSSSLTPIASISPSVSSPSPEPDVTRDTVTLKYSLIVPIDSSVNIRNKPSSTADIIMAVKETVDVYVFKEDSDWRQIGFKESDSTKGYWVNVKFITEK